MSIMIGDQSQAAMSKKDTKMERAAMALFKT
jgi:hypothetical protein